MCSTSKLLLSATNKCRFIDTRGECKEYSYDDIKVALKVTRLFYMMLLFILLPVKLVYVLPVSHL